MKLRASTSIASFISHMENIPHFDAFYACFLTYSTIGFGDIYENTVENAVRLRVLMFFSFIQRTSNRSNWFNLMIYGNRVYVIGYMLLSAWLTTLLKLLKEIFEDFEWVRASVASWGGRWRAKRDSLY